MAKYKSTADSATRYRESTAAPTARVISAADNGNLAAVTRNATFVMVESPRRRALGSGVMAPWSFAASAADAKPVSSGEAIRSTAVTPEDTQR